MPTIAQTAAASNPRSISDRRSHQCARSGWRPRRRPLHQQAQIIAAAIGCHRAAGNSCWLQPHEYTPDAETQELVRELLVASAAACR